MFRAKKAATRGGERGSLHLQSGPPVPDSAVWESIPALEYGTESQYWRSVPQRLESVEITASRIRVTGGVGVSKTHR